MYFTMNLATIYGFRLPTIFIVLLQPVQKISMKHISFCPTLCLLPKLTAFWYVFYNESGNNLWFQITYSFYSILTTCSKILALFTISWYSIITKRMLPPHSKIVAEHSMIEPFCWWSQTRGIAPVLNSHYSLITVGNTKRRRYEAHLLCLD